MELEGVCETIKRGESCGQQVGSWSLCCHWWSKSGNAVLEVDSVNWRVKMRGHCSASGTVYPSNLEVIHDVKCHAEVTHMSPQSDKRPALASCPAPHMTASM